MLSIGQAKLKDGKIVYQNKNQFTEADPVVNNYIKKYGKEKVSLVGHSLGGSLAQYFAVKYDTNAVTFGAADVFPLLTKREQEYALNGNFKDNIISYTYPDDIIGTRYRHAIGSVYYMSDPSIRINKGLGNHGVINYTDNSLFNEHGYFIPSRLYDDTLVTVLTDSPLALKNQGVKGFNILIKSSILELHAKQMEESTQVIENCHKALQRFYDFYSDEMRALKSKYNRAVGHGRFDRLTTADVEEAFRKLRKYENGIPVMFSYQSYENILTDMKDMHDDTGEIAFYMQKMGREFEQLDHMLARWLGFQT